MFLRQSLSLQQGKEVAKPPKPAWGLMLSSRLNWLWDTIRSALLEVRPSIFPFDVLRSANRGDLASQDAGVSWR